MMKTSNVVLAGMVWRLLLDLRTQDFQHASQGYTLKIVSAMSRINFQGHVFTPVPFLALTSL
jgi:hypothetical protein